MQNVVLFGFAVIAAAMDLSFRKVKNWLIMAGFLAGMFFQIHGSGIQGLTAGLLGAAVPLICLGVFFVLRLLGAGDLKLLSVIGCFMGPDKILYCIGAAILAGGAIGIVKLLFCKKKGEKTTICFAVPVLISVLLYQGGVY
ncbi:MAG TPA: prepilin peptidase [Lachnospiraceae bacterium]|nr:prepilin peptidase [Lachnospiraceae bacterium]